MRKYIILAITLFMSSVAFSQIDRSKMPEPGPAPSINFDSPYEFSLDNGLQVLVVENHKLPRVRVSLNIDNPPMAYGDKKGVESMLSSLFGTGTQQKSKEEYNQRIDYLGANVSFGSDWAYMSSLSKYFEEVMGLMAEGILQPKFTQEEFDDQMNKSLEGLKADENSTDAAASRVRKLLDYGVGHPFAESLVKESLENVSLSDVQNHYNAYFVPNNAYLVIVGDVDKKEAKNLVEKYFSGWKNNTSLSFPDMPKTPAVEKTTIQLVNMPNATQSILNISYPVEMDKNNPDYYAVLVASNILGGNFNSRLNMNLREANGWTYGARGGIRDSKYIGRFYANAKVRNAVTDSAVVEAIKEIKKMTLEPVTQKEIENTKAKFMGNYVLSLENPSTVADMALKIKTENLPADFYTNYLKRINAVTIADVERVSKKYFKPENANIHITGKAEDIAPALEKIGYDINYYDKWGTKTGNPVKEVTIPAGATAEKIVGKYLEAIGGAEKAKALKSLKMDFTMTGAAPMPLEGTMAYMAPNKESMVMMMNGSVAMKQTFDGTTFRQSGMMGSAEQTGDEVADKAAKKGIVEQAYYTADQLKLESVSTLNGKEAYKVRVNKDDSSHFEYYDKENYLLLQITYSQETPQGEVPVNVNFSDYVEVDGLKFPSKMSQSAGPQTMNFEFSNIQVNEGVTSSDFE